jgi:hypothetical protein
VLNFFAMIILLIELKSSVLFCSLVWKTKDEEFSGETESTAESSGAVSWAIWKTSGCS